MTKHAVSKLREIAMRGMLNEGDAPASCREIDELLDIYQTHEADVTLNNLLNDLNANEEMTITSENIPQDDAKEPRSELVIRGPERLLTALFYAVIRGRGI